MLQGSAPLGTLPPRAGFDHNYDTDFDRQYDRTFDRRYDTSGIDRNYDRNYDPPVLTVALTVREVGHARRDDDQPIFRVGATSIVDRPAAAR
jgi:hypothetical protein